MSYLARTVLIAAILGVLVIPARMAAAQAAPRYTLIDLGTFGGPLSNVSNPFDDILANSGIGVGWANTPAPDPYPTFCLVGPGCYVTHGFRVQNGVVSDLGTLPGGPNSQAFVVSGSGVIAGISQNGQTDPAVSGCPELHAVLWTKGTITDLGTLDGGSESAAFGIDNSGRVTGAATNTVSDLYSMTSGAGFCPNGDQVRAFLWKKGTMTDLGTLGGPDAVSEIMSDAGDVAGQSYINSSPNANNGPLCAPNVPTQDPFLWTQGGGMKDLGTLGGTCGVARAVNNHGDEVGMSELAGNSIYHPFIWSPKQGMVDLGTLGGDTGEANWINDAGEVVGKADLGGASTQLHDAYLWQNGVMTDLHTLPGDACSDAFFVNDHHQVVGTSETAAYCQPPAQGEHAFLWEKGQMFDLNQLIPSGSDLELTYAMAINDQGEILGLGAPRGCVPINVGVCGHAYMLIPQELAQSEGLPAAMQLGASSTPRGQASGTRGRAASPARGRLAG